jgi:hypothetical protein
MKPVGRLSLAALASCLALGAVLALSAAAERPASAPSVKRLFRGAVQRVRANPKFARAVMLEVDGKTRNDQGVRGAGGIVKFRFVFDNQDTRRSPFASAFVHYGPPPKGYAAVHGVKSPFLEDRRIPHPPKMTLKRAVKLLRAAGYRDKFSNVTLRKPLTQRLHTHPLYIFGFGRGMQSYIAVDTKTGAVGPIS